jgi:hypothetical protein
MSLPVHLKGRGSPLKLGNITNSMEGPQSMSAALCSAENGLASI